MALYNRATKAVPAEEQFEVRGGRREGEEGGGRGGRLVCNCIDRITCYKLIIVSDSSH